MRRWALALAAVAIALQTTSIASAQSPQPAIEISVSNDAVRARVDAAAKQSIASYTEWLGPAPFTRLRIADAGDADVFIGLPLLSRPGDMNVESQVATGISRAWFENAPASPSWRSEGASVYLQGRVLEQLFNRAFLKPGYRYDGMCFFVCQVRWVFPSLPQSRWTEQWGPSAAFASLERELGWPTLQGAFRAAVASQSDPAVAMSDAVGRDLRPVFEAALVAFADHAIAALDSTPATCASACYRTVVTIARNGPVPFPLVVRVAFANGEVIDTRWDGKRDRLEFESASPAIEARLDPDRVWLLDRNFANNASVQPRPTNVPVWKWMARWITWMQDALLMQTFPV